MSDDESLRRHGWRGKDKKERKGSLASLSPSPFLSPRYSPRISSPSRSKVSPRPERNRRRNTWRIPQFLRRKLDRNSDRVSGILPEVSARSANVAATPAFEDPFECKKSYPSSLRDKLQQSTFKYPSIIYTEPQVHDVGGLLREAKYLDLFDPRIQVIRDPKLDQPRRTWKHRLKPLFTSNFGAVAPTTFIIGCFVVLATLVIGIVAIVTVSRLLKIPPDDPRISYPYVTTATSCGLVKGVIEKGGFVFRGVPFALPPVQNLRLRSAQVHNSLRHCWTNNNYSANVSRPCWTYDYQGAIVPGFEDCLLLDVFTPKLGYENPLPVILYIGGASLGSDSRRSRLLSEAITMALKKRVVIVSPQIRRGMLGFMPSPVIAASTYPHTSGNQGASDLMASIMWIHYNIEHFGGDKNKVTVLGHQAGAALVWPMLKRITSKNLVHAAWLSGAAPFNPRTMWRRANTAVARPLNCSSARCIELKSAEIVMDAGPVPWRSHNGRPWLVRDGIFIPDAEETPQMPIMFGSTEQTAAEYLMPWRNLLTSSQVLKEAVFNTLQELQDFTSYYLQDPLDLRPVKRPVSITTTESASAISQYSATFSDNPWLHLTTLISDATVTCPLLQRAASLARQWAHSVPTSRRFLPPIYSYVSEHRRVSQFGSVADSLSDIEAILGVLHQHSHSDSQFVATMQDLFYTFAETGAPLRHLSTPAHHGIYVIKDTFKVTRDRHWCEYWFNKLNWSRRF